ncbi:hypothetical protein [Halovivax sp.]|uniref:hypothetical protein n=1 Tax=Halovivax sp. TaxID=1935978 RepID=UPI0025B853E3|nr:hypothetical protein [Halovivax sp.]
MLSIENVADEPIDGEGEEVIRLTNRSNVPFQSFTFDVSVGSGLTIAEEFDDGELVPDESTSLYLSCESGSGGGYTAVDVAIEEANGGSIAVTDLSRSYLIERDCPGGSDDPFFDVEITDTNSPIGEGDTLEVDARIRNTGIETDTQEVVLEIGNEQRDGETVELDGGEEGEIELQWTETVAGTYDAIVRTDDEEDSTTVEVESDEAYTIEHVSLSDGGGNDIDVTVEVSTDDSDAILEIISWQGDEQRDRKTVSAEDGTYSIAGRRQADQVQVNLRDGDDSVRHTVWREWNR